MSTVSVVIPSYNRADLVGETIRSILAQTAPPLEILVVDDGSTDDTQAVCAAFPAPVRYIRQQNTGLPGARNRGIREARGEWIALCDSDDLWHPYKLEAQMAALGAVPGARWSLTGCTLIGPDGSPVPEAPSSWERVFAVFRDCRRTPDEHFTRALARSVLDARGGPYTLYSGELFELLFDGNVALPSSAIIARSLLDEVGLFDESFHVAEETEFFHRTAAASPVALVASPLVSYRTGHASIISSGDPTALIRNALTSLDRAAALRPRLSAQGLRALRDGKRRLHTKLAHARLSLSDTRGAREALTEAWREWPVPTPRLVALTLASITPAPLLRELHRARRGLKR